LIFSKAMDCCRRALQDSAYKHCPNVGHIL